MSKSGIEQEGLLQPESFDFDDVESAEPSNGHAPNGHAKRPNEDWSRARRTWKSAPPWLRPRCFMIGLFAVAALLVFGIALNKGSGFKLRRLHKGPPPRPLQPAVPTQPPFSEVKQWSKPEGFKIIGLIFFGRPSVVAILDCYLKKNLVSNGGWLDEVHWVVNTENEDDIKYLDELVESSKIYKKIIIPSLGYNEVWANAVEREHMYIKIDDDIVSACGPYATPPC